MQNIKIISFIFFVAVVLLAVGYALLVGDKTKIYVNGTVVTGQELGVTVDHEFRVNLVTAQTYVNNTLLISINKREAGSHGIDLVITGFYLA